MGEGGLGSGGGGEWETKDSGSWQFWHPTLVFLNCSLTWIVTVDANGVLSILVISVSQSQLGCCSPGGCSE